jgi:hypothetical protein
VSQFLFYPAFTAAIIFYDWRIVLGVFVLRMLSLYIIYGKAFKKLNEADLSGLLLFFDIWQFFYYLIFTPSLWRKPKRTWQ